jgi:hypothetical protein
MVEYTSRFVIVFAFALAKVRHIFHSTKFILDYFYFVFIKNTPIFVAYVYSSIIPHNLHTSDPYGASL